MRPIIKMFGLIPEQKRRIVGTILLNTLIGLGALAPPYFLKLIIDALIAVTSRKANLGFYQHRIIVSLLGMLMVLVILAITNYIQERTSDLLRLGTNIGLRQRLFEHVLELSVDYYETHRAGEIVQRVTQGVYDFGVWIQEMSQTVLLRIFTIIFSVIVIAIVQPWAGSAIAITVIVKLSVAIRKKRVTRPDRLESRAILERTQGQVTESIQNLTTLRSFGGEAGAVRAHLKLGEEIRVARMRQHQIEWRYNVVLVIIEAIGVVGVLAILAKAALDGKSSAGDIVLVSLYCPTGYGKS